MMQQLHEVEKIGLTAFKFVAMAGFLTTATLLINLNFKAFNKIFREKTKSFWWLFALLTIIPLLLIIYIFNLLFSRGRVY